MTNTRTLPRVVLKWATALLAVGALAAAVIFIDGAEDRELRRLPEPDRRTLYLRTLDTLKSSCMHATGPKLTDYCREQADFISRFPECEKGCRELAHRFAPKPTHVPR